MNCSMKSGRTEMLIEITNNFHQTSTKVRTDDGTLTESQRRKALNALCSPDCHCSGAFGQRGPQPDGITLVAHPEGGGYVEFRE